MKNKKTSKQQSRPTKKVELSMGFTINPSPYVIHLKNLTDDKLYNVKLFNYEGENKSRVQYSCPLKDVDYGDIIKTLQAQKKPKTIIRTMRAIAVCDYRKFQFKQINCEYLITDTEPNGKQTCLADRLMLDPYSYQDNICVKSGLEMKFYKGLQIELAFLMPETEMTFYLFPKC